MSPAHALSRRRRGGALVGRVVAGIALVGYVAVLGAPSAGAGWRLLAHLASESHAGANPAYADERQPPAAGTLPSTASPLPEGEGQGEGANEAGDAPESAHAQTQTHTHGDGGPHVHDAPARDAEVAEPPAAPEPHAHGEHVHTHGEDPPSASVLPVALDKHTVAAVASVPAPIAGRGADAVRPASSHEVVSRPVETPPPRRAS